MSHLTTLAALGESAFALSGKLDRRDFFGLAFFLGLSGTLTVGGATPSIAYGVTARPPDICWESFADSVSPVFVSSAIDSLDWESTRALSDRSDQLDLDLLAFAFLLNLLRYCLLLQLLLIPIFIFLLL